MATRKTRNARPENQHASNPAYSTAVSFGHAHSSSDAAFAFPLNRCSDITNLRFLFQARVLPVLAISSELQAEALFFP